MHKNKLHSAALVAAQIVLIVLICTRALPANPETTWVPALFFIATACVLALAAIISLRLSNLSVMPEPVQQGELITSGPYKLIRHPMYTAVILGCSGMLLLNINLLSGLFLLALIVVLLLKVRREESLLQATYSGYADYRENTGALIPKFSKQQ